MAYIEMEVHNKTELMAAIAAVDPDCDTLIRLVRKDGKTLYKFPGTSKMSAVAFERHLDKIIRQVKSTPASAFQ